MSSQAKIDDTVRKTIISRPDVILDDQDLMRALVAANERTMGGNVIDLRGLAMERLEARLDRLEDTHRSVIAAAYENLAGTNQIHRATLRLLDARNFETFLMDLGGPVADMLRVDSVRLVIETLQTTQEQAINKFSDVLECGRSRALSPFLSWPKVATCPSARGHNAPRYSRSGPARSTATRSEFIRSEALPDPRPSAPVACRGCWHSWIAEDPHHVQPRSRAPTCLSFFCRRVRTGRCAAGWDDFTCSARCSGGFPDAFARS